MLVRLNYGRYAGEVLDIAPVEAQQLLASGRAEDPFAPAAEIVEKIEVPKTNDRPRTDKRTHR